MRLVLGLGEKGLVQLPSEKAVPLEKAVFVSPLKSEPSSAGGGWCRAGLRARPRRAKRRADSSLCLLSGSTLALRLPFSHLAVLGGRCSLRMLSKSPCLQSKRR